MSITHTTAITGTNDATKQVSKDAWNADHTITDATLSIAKTSGLQTALDNKAALAGTATQVFSCETPTAATHAVPADALQLQSTIHCGTTGGTSTAYTLSATPALAANTAKARIRGALHTAAGATPTLAVNGLAALAIKYLNASGAEIAITATQGVSGWSSDFEINAAANAWIMLDVPSSSSAESLVVNSGFTINQEGYVSAATLASGAYGHDQWKAGAGGGDYTFTQLNSDTQITIAANKTLIQVIEDKQVQSTSYVLSWEGTALARYAVNSATPAGAYAASPITITGQTAGATMSIEFGNGASTGTLGKVMLSEGSVALTRKARDYNKELELCKYYYRRYTQANGDIDYTLMWTEPTTAIARTYMQNAMRVSPTVLMSPVFNTGAGWMINDSVTNNALTGTPTILDISTNGMGISVGMAATGAVGRTGNLYNNTGSNGYWALDARL